MTRNRFVTAAVMLVVIGALGCLSGRAALVYALVNGANASLETIDTSTATVTPIGATGAYANFGDLAPSPTPGVAYMVDGRQPGGVGNSSLYTVNLTTGAATLVGSTGVPDMFGLAYDSDTGTIFGTTYSVGVVGLYSLNGSTGAAQFIGPTSISNNTREIDALTYNPTTHTLIGISTGFSSLYALDESTGTLTLQAALQPSGGTANHNIGDLAYDAANNRYFSEDVDGQLFVTDPTNAPVFNDVRIMSGLGDIDGLLAQTVPAPEPATGLLLAPALVLVATRRRRCKPALLL